VVTHKDYVCIQLSEDMRCTNCGYQGIEGTPMWVVQYPKKGGALCNTCLDNKRHEQECINH
jgi:hypothetical protein